jgi:hypothetical protein
MKKGMKTRHKILATLITILVGMGYGSAQPGAVKAVYVKNNGIFTFDASDKPQQLTFDPILFRQEKTQQLGGDPALDLLKQIQQVGGLEPDFWCEVCACAKLPRRSLHM